MSVTIKTIAKDLNLAISTVSKALGDSHEISPETKKRIFEYAKRLDYVPNAYAGSLKKRKTANIAIIIPEVADSFFSLAINGIESVAQKKGFHVIVYLTHEDQLKEQSILHQLKNGRVDGLLLSVSSGAFSNDHIKYLLNAKIPVVFFDRSCDDIDANKVLTNDFESGYLAAELLINKKCKKISFLSLSDDLSIINQRLKGYKKALVDHKISIDENLIIHCTNDEISNHAKVSKLFQSADKPDAIIGSVEKLTMLIYAVCFDLKVSIPRDLKVIGFSSLDIASFLNPSLTTITQPAFEIGKTAATILFQELEKNSSEPKRTIIIPSKLIERGSTK
ncbi:MAG: LacI family DNA-binding transcriptional regulator [Chryseolinea sp.]